MSGTKKALVSVIASLLFLWLGIPSSIGLGFIIADAIEEGFLRVMPDQQMQTFVKQVFNNVRWGLVILGWGGLIADILILLRSSKNPDY